MDERQMNELLLAAFPELKEEFEEYASWQDGIDTGAFLTYEDIFRPYIERAVENGDLAFLDRASTFIEDLYLTEDEYAVNVVYVGILEGLKANCDNEAVRSFLKPITQGEFAETAFSSADRAKISKGPFCLSIEEAEKYFADDDDRICQVTTYAAVHGAFNDDDPDTGVRWWLRSPGEGMYSSNFASNVGADGSINKEGLRIDDAAAVRPALWVEL